MSIYKMQKNAERLSEEIILKARLSAAQKAYSYGKISREQLLEEESLVHWEMEILKYTEDSRSRNFAGHNPFHDGRDSSAGPFPPLEKDEMSNQFGSFKYFRFLFPKMHREEWVGDILEMITEMKAERQPRWRITCMLILNLAVVLFYAAKFKLGDFFDNGTKKQSN